MIFSKYNTGLYIFCVGHVKLNDVVFVHFVTIKYSMKEGGGSSYMH